jgi:tetratricopeptide (TPR) repeat protein
VTADEDRNFDAVVLGYLREVWSKRSWVELEEYLRGNTALVCDTVRAAAGRLVDVIEAHAPDATFTGRVGNSEEQVEVVPACRHAISMLTHAATVIVPAAPVDGRTSAVLGFLKDMTRPVVAELLLENADLYEGDGLVGSCALIDSLVQENSLSVGRRLTEVRKLLIRCADVGVAAAVAEADFQVPFPHQAFPPAVVELVESAWAKSGDRDRLDKLIDLYKIVMSSDAADAMTPDAQGHMHNNISDAYLRRWRREVIRDDIDRSIECGQRAIDAYATRELSDHARINQAHKFSERFSDRGDVADLNQAISINEFLLRRLDYGGRDWLYVTDSLGTALKDRFRCKGEPADLARARMLLADAVEVAAQRYPIELPHIQHQLALALHESYQFSGNLDFLAGSIVLHRDSFEVTRRSDPSWPVRAQALGDRLRHQFELTKDEQTLEESIAISRDVLDSGLGRPTLRYGVQSNLAMALEHRFSLRNDQADIDFAISLMEELLSIEPHASSIRPGHVLNLASCLLMRHHVTSDRGDLDRALDLFESAEPGLLRPTRLGQIRSSMWAQALIARYDRTGTDAHLAQAVDLFRELCVSATNTGAAELGWEMSVRWATWAQRRKDWDEAVEAYRHALVFAEQWHSRQRTDSERRVVARLLGTRAWEMAYACGKAGELSTAVTMLEQARCLWLDDVMGVHAADLASLAGIDPSLYRDWLDAKTRLIELSGTDAIAAVRAQDVLDELAVLRDRIRILPGLENFQRRPDIREVHAKATREPVVYLISATEGGFAFIVTEFDVCSVELPNFTLAAFNERSLPYFNAEVRSTGKYRDISEFIPLTTWLWTNVVALLEEPLAGIDAIVLIPTGPIMQLPWHAARAIRDDTMRCWLDSCRVTYAPTVRVLGMPLEGPPGAVLAVGDPVGGNLPWSTQELQVAAVGAQSRIVAGEEATPARVFDLIGNFDVVHFACHGKLDLSRPMSSALVLAGGSRLAVGDLAHANLSHLRLAVLSACDSAFPSIDLVYEAVGFPAILMSAGVVGVIGTLWPVSDDSTALLMERFYSNWRAGLAPTEALRCAQQWLRSQDPYVHPYYWAGFVFYGR